MFPRVTHPSATDVLLRPFDLHVLSLPPAFVLSQDQTLKFDENLILTGHSRRSLAAPPSFDEFQTHPLDNSRASPPHGVPALTVERDDCLWKRDRQWSRREPRQPGLKPSQRQAPRKDHAAHVSLSSDALVKQRGSNPAEADPIREPCQVSRRHARKARPSPKPTIAASSRGWEDRKPSVPTSQQGGAHPRSPETRRLRPMNRAEPSVAA